MARQRRESDGRYPERMLGHAKRGDTAAVAWLYDEYRPRIYRYLLSRTGDPDLADDLTSSVFLKVVDAVQSGTTWDTSITGWLYRIAHNVLSDHRRVIVRRPECALPKTLPGGTDAAMDEYAEKGIKLEVVQNALSELRPDYADVIRLRFGEGLPHAAVALQLGKSEGAVKVAQHRALKVLRSRLAPQLGQPV
jgi:RNA polymerase sigma-70 factor (ECF subfamily)